MQKNRYFRDCLLGALSAALMLVGDLCLSVIPASQTDHGLFAREAYFSELYPAWRLPLLTATGLLGMALGFFTVRASCRQILPQYRKTRRLVLVGGVLYLTSAGAVHALIGSLADWTSALSPLLGASQTEALVYAQYQRLLPTLSISYIGMLLLALTGLWALAAKKTILPRRMLLVHMLPVQLVLVLIPDVRQALGAQITTWDFVLSQCSGNGALLLWMLTNAVWAGCHPEACADLC